MLFRRQTDGLQTVVSDQDRHRATSGKTCQNMRRTHEPKKPIISSVWVKTQSEEIKKNSFLLNCFQILNRKLKEADFIHFLKMIKTCDA